VGYSERKRGGGSRDRKKGGQTRGAASLQQREIMAIAMRGECNRCKWRKRRDFVGESIRVDFTVDGKKDV